MFPSPSLYLSGLSLEDGYRCPVLYSSKLTRTLKTQATQVLNGHYLEPLSQSHPNASRVLLTPTRGVRIVLGRDEQCE